MAPKRKPDIFAPSDRAREKRTVQYSLRMSDSELALLEREAARRGVTSLNLIRELLANALARKRKSRR